MHAIVLAAFCVVGFLVGGVLGAAAILLPWALVTVITWHLRGHKADLPREVVTSSRPSVYADIEEIIGRLDAIAQDRGWDIGKRFEIARMACENRAATFDELERRYDKGIRSALYKERKGGSGDPETDSTV